MDKKYKITNLKLLAERLKFAISNSSVFTLYSHFTVLEAIFVMYYK